jgi:hypothetical protein
MDRAKVQGHPPELVWPKLPDQAPALARLEPPGTGPRRRPRRGWYPGAPPAQPTVESEAAAPDMAMEAAWEAIRPAKMRFLRGGGAPSLVS